MKTAQKSMDRIKNILKMDKENISLSLISLLKSDIFSVIDGYFVSSLQDIKMNYYVSEDGKYHLSFEIECSRIKKLNYLSV